MEGLHGGLAAATTGDQPLLGATDLQQHSVSAEQLQLLHGLRVEGHDRVVIVHGLVHDQAVGRGLAAKNGR
jgi:hypothetical protein